jgi:hypothetical protein
VITVIFDPTCQISFGSLDFDFVSMANSVTDVIVAIVVAIAVAEFVADVVAIVVAADLGTFLGVVLAVFVVICHFFQETSFDAKCSLYASFSATFKLFMCLIIFSGLEAAQ